MQRLDVADPLQNLTADVVQNFLKLDPALKAKLESDQMKLETDRIRKEEEDAKAKEKEEEMAKFTKTQPKLNASVLHFMARTMQKPKGGVVSNTITSESEPAKRRFSQDDSTMKKHKP